MVPLLGEAIFRTAAGWRRLPSDVREGATWFTGARVETIGVADHNLRSGLLPTVNITRAEMRAG